MNNLLIESSVGYTVINADHISAIAPTSILIDNKQSIVIEVSLLSGKSIPLCAPSPQYNINISKIIKKIYEHIAYRTDDEIDINHIISEVERG